MFTKAAREFKAHRGGVAAYYSSEGHQLTKEIEGLESAYRYHEFCQANRGNRSKTTLDLHGLTVPEALENLEWWLEMKTAELGGVDHQGSSASQKTQRLEIVTGKGTSSKAKIKPAVIKYLGNIGLNYQDLGNPGSLVVVVKK